MKIITLFVFILTTNLTFSQSAPSPNFIIVTTDGFRWNEVFEGADSAIINNPEFVKDTALLKQMFWDNDINERRKMLMPFVWRNLVKQGSIYGNRNYENKVTVANPYRFSYAGYNEIFTGYADPAVITNHKKWNSNENLLDFLNEQPAYKNKVAAFTSWNLFPYILNSRQGNIYLNSGYQTISNDSLSRIENTLNTIQQNVMNSQDDTRNDMLTFVTAKEYIQNNHPKVIYIGFGETDEYAHGGHYDEYLQSAHLFDEYLAQLWYLVNKDPFYKNNTSIIITTDHGRGEKPGNWIRHGLFTPGSSSAWLMTLGPGFEIKGEVKTKTEIFNDQLAQTIVGLLGYDFIAIHPVGDPVPSLTSTGKR